jgi:hypothetical protein
MGELIVLAAGKHQNTDRLNELWNAYVVAREKAEKSRDIMDGIAAGAIWAQWLNMFTGRAQ